MKTKADIKKRIETIEEKILEYQRKTIIEKMNPPHIWDMSKIQILDNRVSLLQYQKLSLDWVLDRSEMLVY